jgi:glutamate dehydrogenase
MDALSGKLDAILTPRQRSQHAETVARMMAGGVPAGPATRLSMLDHLGSIPALTRLAADTRRPVTEVAGIGFAAAEHLRIGELKARAGALKITDYYDRLAVNGAISTLDAAARGLTRDVLRDANGKAGDFAAWARSNAARLAPAKSALDEIVGTGEISVSRLTVAAGQVRELVGA